MYVISFTLSNCLVTKTNINSIKAVKRLCNTNRHVWLYKYCIINHSSGLGNFIKFGNNIPLCRGSSSYILINEVVAHRQLGTHHR